MRSQMLVLFAFLLLISACNNIDIESDLPFARKMAINDNWHFRLHDSINPNNPELNDRNWRMVDLPHDWAIEGPFSKEYASGTGYLPGGIGWYAKKLEIPEYKKDRRYVLMFDGAYQNAEVWINGQYLGKRPYGYISFYYDITNYLDDAGSNILVVKLDHSIVSDSRWYTGNGIYRNVWLLTTGNVFIDTWSSFVSTPEINEQEALASVEFRIKNKLKTAKDIQVANVILNPAGELCAQWETKFSLQAEGDSILTFDHRIAEAKLWSPESPEIYTSVTRIYDIEGELLDLEETKFGIREIEFTADKGFFCNGKPYKLKGVCMHHDYGPLGAARTPEAIYPVLKKLKEAGCNAIRTSHNPEDPEYLNMLDTMGFFVLEEAFDEFRRGKKKWIKGRNVGQRLGIKAYPEYYNRNGYSDFYDDWAKQDIQDMVKRDRNHPSIIMWSVGNETDYPNDPYQDPNVKSTFDPTLPTADEIAVLVKDLAGWIRELDKTRPVTQALANVRITNEYGVPELLDVVGYNYQEYRYEEDHNEYPQRIIYGSENDDNPDAWKAVRDNDYISGQFLWTGMDYHGEAGIFPWHSFSGGIIDYCGFEKPEYYYRKSLWTDKAMAKLVVSGQRRWSQEMHWNFEMGNRRRVNCYTNCDEAELFLNGESLGRKPYNDERLSVSWRTDYVPGILTVTAYRDGKAVCYDTLQTAGVSADLAFRKSVVHSETFDYDLIQVEVNMVDKNKVLVPDASSRIDFRLEGEGEILGVCNSNYRSLESYKADHRKLHNGKCLLIIKTPDKNHLSLHAGSEVLDKEYTLNFR